MNEVRRPQDRIRHIKPIRPVEESAKIMIVDDDSMAIEIVIEQLRHAGYREFISCTDSSEAMELLRDQRPDVLLLDIVMPKIDGYQILDELRTEDIIRFTPVIVLTADVDARTKVRALDLGATDFLTKPVDHVELLPRVRNALVVKAYQDSLQRRTVDLEKMVDQKTRQLQESYRDLASAHEALQESCIAAQAANHAKDQFLANISHEIRTPLTAILGFADLLAEPDSSEEERSSHLDTIRKNGRILLRLVDDVLDFASIESGEMIAERADCRADSIVDSVVTMMRPRAAEKGLSLEVDYQCPLQQTIRTDPIRLRQILVNLVGNAVKFTQQGRVSVVIRYNNGANGKPRMQFQVSDTGIGMTAEELTHLFEPFTQVDASMTRRFGGTGLGLTISIRLAGLLGGGITVESEPGHGSIFTLTIDPGIPESAQIWDGLPGLPCEESAPEVSGPDLAGRVLLAEDGLDNQRLIALVLKKAGLEVDLAENGKEAYERASAAAGQGRPYDLILMDMQMPVLDGYDATQQLRSEGYGGPIVALTAHTAKGDQQRCLDVGCDDYSTKPINRQELVALATKHIGSPSQPSQEAVCCSRY